MSEYVVPRDWTFNYVSWCSWREMKAMKRWHWTWGWSDLWEYKLPRKSFDTLETVPKDLWSSKILPKLWIWQILKKLRELISALKSKNLFYLFFQEAIFWEHSNFCFSYSLLFFQFKYNPKLNIWVTCFSLFIIQWYYRISLLWCCTTY